MPIVYSVAPKYKLSGLHVGFDEASVKSNVFRPLLKVLYNEMMTALEGYIGSFAVTSSQ